MVARDDWVRAAKEPLRISRGAGKPGGRFDVCGVMEVREGSAGTGGAAACDAKSDPRLGVDLDEMPLPERVEVGRRLACLRSDRGGVFG